MPLIIPSNSISAGGYEVDNSLRFNDDSTDYLNKTFASAGNRKTWTWSSWIKISTLDKEHNILMGGNTSYNDAYIRITGGNQLRYLIPDGTTTVGTLNTTQVLRDISAWYHIVCVYDSTNSTSNERMRIYINGNRITDFVTELYPSQNQDSYNINNASPHYIGAKHDATTLFDGYMAEVCFIDGQALDPTSFGEFDEDTGIWKPIDVSELTFGTNGFYLDFENSGSLGADVSGNGNNFTVNNLTSIDQTTDTPTNNFCTLNPLDNYYGSGTFAEGNLKVTTPSSGSAFNTGTIGVSSGKWFWEVKYVSDTDGSANYSRIGITGRVATASNDSLGNSNSMQYASINGAKGYNGGSNSYGDTYAPGDIIGVALDLDSGTQTITFYKNGSSQGAIDLALINGGTPTGFWFPAVHYDDGSHSGVFEANFGNPPYSANGYSDANGYGNMSYSVPSGFYILNSKNLAEFG